MSIPVVDWLKEIMPADEFDRWVAYYRIRPFDDESNFQIPIAGLHATLININRAPNSRPTTREECMPFRRAPERDIDQILASDEW